MAEIIRCAGCGAPNRCAAVSAHKAVCGRCKQTLLSSSEAALMAHATDDAAISSAMLKARGIKNPPSQEEILGVILNEILRQR